MFIDLRQWLQDLIIIIALQNKIEKDLSFIILNKNCSENNNMIA